MLFEATFRQMRTTGKIWLFQTQNPLISQGVFHVTLYPESSAPPYSAIRAYINCRFAENT
jgi:hypothetical protein